MIILCLTLNNKTMGTLKQGGPNPYETDVNSERYTAINKIDNRVTTMGIIGDADTLIGKGFERQFIAANMELNVEAGDFAYCGNRVGMVTAVTKNGTTGKIETITVREEIGQLPLDWKDEAEAFGYTDDVNSTSRIVVYAIGEGLSDDVINGAGVLLGTGSILVCKKKTSDKSTWTQEAQNADLFQEKQKPKAVSIEITPTNADRIFTGEDVQYSASILPAEASQEVIWSIEYESGEQNIPEKVFIDQNGLVTFDNPNNSDTSYVVTAKSKYNNSVFGIATFDIVAD